MQMYLREPIEAARKTSYTPKGGKTSSLGGRPTNMRIKVAGMPGWCRVCTRRMGSVTMSFIPCKGDVMLLDEFHMQRIQSLLG